MTWQQWISELFRIQDLMQMPYGTIIIADKAYAAYKKGYLPSQYLE
jgi:hypothetical protein